MTACLASNDLSYLPVADSDLTGRRSKYLLDCEVTLAMLATMASTLGVVHRGCS